MATSTVTINALGWTDLGPGPVRVARQNVAAFASPAEKAIIDAADPYIFIHIGVADPGDVNAFESMKQTLNYTGSENVFARCASGQAIVVVTPIV